ncbi:sporulation protein [Aliivibrio fischeri]|uniref:sporulation protein n=1 Tax=Aliivibrio fischeri TaxID=668 RepID=UPI0012D993ED
MNRILVRFGRGSARIETVIHTEKIKPLGVVVGHFKITGGKLDQKIERVSLKIFSIIKLKFGMLTRSIKIPIQNLSFDLNRIIEKNSEVYVPFRFVLSSEIPITELISKFKSQTEVFAISSLDIRLAGTPCNTVPLKIHPTRTVNHYINALSHQGYNLIKYGIEQGVIKLSESKTYSGFYQELHFKQKTRLKNKKIKLVFFNSIEDTCCVIDGKCNKGANTVMNTPNSVGYSQISNELTNHLQSYSLDSLN